MDYQTYIRDRFAAAVVKTEPCAHLIIENVLPPELYASIDRDIPHPMSWKLAALLATVMNGALPSFNPRNVTQPTIDCKMPSRGSRLFYFQSKKWKRKYYEAIALVNQLVESAFEPMAADYMKQLVAAGIFLEPQQQAALVHEFAFRLQGWTIDPHTHDIGQALQWMIYFPLPGSTEDQGTLFYKLTKPKRFAADALRGSMYFDHDETEHSFSVPYRANTLIAFINTPHAIHGTVELPDMVARRYFFICNWWKSQPNLKDITVNPPSTITSELPL